MEAPTGTGLWSPPCVGLSLGWAPRKAGTEGPPHLRGARYTRWAARRSPNGIAYLHSLSGLVPGNA